jgi:hypothetical protein
MATLVHVSTRTRGRNQRIVVHQTGLQRRHCAPVTVSQAMYSPATLLGLYNAAQNKTNLSMLQRSTIWCVCSERMHAGYV